MLGKNPQVQPLTKAIQALVICPNASGKGRKSAPALVMSVVCNGLYWAVVAAVPRGATKKEWQVTSEVQTRELI